METKKLNEGEAHQEDPTEEEKPEPSHVPDRHYIKLDTRLLRYWLPAIGSNAVIVYEIIVDCFNARKGYAYPSLAQIQNATDLGKKAVRKAINKLVEVKLVRLWPGGGRGRANRYIPLPPLVTAEVVKLIRESGREVIIDHLHLFSDAENKLGPKEPSLEKTGAERAQGVGSKEPSTKIENEDLNKEQQQEGPNIVTTGKQESYHSENVVVDNFVNSQKKEGEGITQLTTEIREAFPEKDLHNLSKAIGKLIGEYNFDFVSQKVAIAKAQKESIENPIGFLKRACEEDFRPVEEIIHLYKVKEPKSESQIADDAKELRQGAAVERESARRLARDFESYYLRRNIAQINRDHGGGRTFKEPGLELVRRIEKGYEPKDYPPRE